MENASQDGGGTFRVLVADDSRETRELLFEALSSIGCAVTCAADGLEAFAALETERYDLLITDYQMPRLNGLALLRRVEPRTPRLPAILITGHISSGLIEEAKRAGAILVIPKPVPITPFLSFVTFIRDLRLTL